MLSKELISLLKTFSPKEFKQFEQFLNSSYSNKNKKLVDLLLLLKASYPSFVDKHLTKEFLFKNIYPGKAYHDPTLRNLFSDLNDAAETFLSSEASKIDSFHGGETLLGILHERNLPAHFRKEMKHLDNQLAGEGLSCAYLEKKYTLENHKLNFRITYDNNIDRKAILKRIDHVNSSAKYLTSNFIIEIINRLIKINIYKEKYNADGSPAFLTELAKCIDFDLLLTIFDDTECSELLRMYSALNKMLQNKDDLNFYFRYKELYEKNTVILSRNERAFHNSYLINYCVSNLYTMEAGYDFRIDLFKLYKELVMHEYYKSDANDYLPADLFRAILITALNVKEYYWAQQFINTNYLKLHNKDKDNMISLGFFLLYGYTGKYEQSLNQLNKVKFDNFIFKYDEHLLKIKIFYELGMLCEGLDSIHSFREFVHNNTFESELRKKKYLNFINFAEKVFSSKLGNEKIDIDYLQFKLVEETNIVYKDWLLEKMRNESKNIPKLLEKV